MTSQLGSGQLGALQLGGKAAPVTTGVWNADAKQSCSFDPQKSLKWTCNSASAAAFNSLGTTLTAQLGRARLGKLHLGGVDSFFIGVTWEARQIQACSWVGPPPPARWPVNQPQICSWVPSYINVWVSLNRTTCSWKGSLGAHITSGWVLQNKASCSWFVVNTNPGKWESKQLQQCEWIPTIQAVPEDCLTGSGLPVGASKGANYAF